ncbi:MAG: sugar transferase [Bacteroidales bacterium]|nr:sugar transferase [Bacteroidales bacterium]
MKTKLLYIENSEQEQQSFKAAFAENFEIMSVENGLQALKILENGRKPDAIVCKLNLPGMSGRQLLHVIRSRKEIAAIPFIFISNNLQDEELMELLLDGANDYFPTPLNFNKLSQRIGTLIALSLSRKQSNSKRRLEEKAFKMPVIKRALDILISGTALLILSPIFLLVVMILKLSSRGAVIYVSKRVGTGYKIFDLYKFRTMNIDADQKLADMNKLNIYNNSSDENKDNSALFNEKCPDCMRLQKPCSPLLYSDGEIVCENFYLQQQNKRGSIFFKIKDDPRITGFGKILRNTSIDELPQLFNILKGDMSLVGNRPLPLYEAEKLTTDEWTERFLAPSGLTGLWQVTKRGDNEMSAEERINLDNVYARNYSFWNDINIILKTFPALIQKENV